MIGAQFSTNSCGGLISIQASGTVQHNSKVKKTLKIEEKICSKLEVIEVWNLPLLPQHSLSDLQSKGFPKGRRHSVSNLTVLVPDGARKVKVIPEMTKFKFWSCCLSA